MPLSLELNTKCRFCGGKLPRNSIKQNIYYCSKECRKEWRNRKRKEDKKRNRERAKNRIGTQALVDAVEKTQTQVSGASISSVPTQEKPKLRRSEKKTVTQLVPDKKFNRTLRGKGDR